MQIGSKIITALQWKFIWAKSETSKNRQGAKTKSKFHS